VDGHCFIPGRHLLYDTARIMHERAVDALARPQPLRTPWNSDFQDVVASVRESALGHGRDSTIYSMDYSGPVDPTSSGATYKRSLFAEIGYYDEQFDACEDVEFNHRVKAGAKRCYIDPTLAIFYVPRPNLSGLFRQLSRYGLGRARLHQKHPEAASLSQLAPAAVLALPFIALLALWLHGCARVLLVAPLALYLAICVVAAIACAAQNGMNGFYGFPALISVHAGLGFGWLRGITERRLAALNTEPQHARSKRMDV
jgi:GT2 family glycosyltransferase